MQLVIETYWNKVVPDKNAAFGSRVLPEYELKDRVFMGEDPRTIDQLRKDSRSRFPDKYMREPESGKFKFDLGRSYGIHSYQIIYIK